MSRDEWEGKGAWKKQVEEESVKVGLRWEDWLCRIKCFLCVNHISVRLMSIRPPSLDRDTTRLM